MSDDTTLRFAGSDEELKKLLTDAARVFGGWPARDRIVFGHFLSLNPNTARWQLRVRREGETLRLVPVTLTWPWTRAKHERIARFRVGQIADYLEVRLRGSASDKFEARPFVTAGRGVANVTMAWTWLILSCLACGLATWLATTLASFFVIDEALRQLADRARLVGILGGVSLPSPAELGSIDRLGAAALLAFPLAFFLGSLYALVQVAAEFGRPFSRAGWLVFVFEAFFLGLALVPVLSIPTAVAMSLLIPASAHAGYSLVWGRKGEKRRDLAPGPRRPLQWIAAFILGGLLFFVLVPAPRERKEVTKGLAVFRDRYLLPNAPGRWIAKTYYRYTLYTAEPMKDFYDPSEAGYPRQIRTALLARTDPAVEGHLRKMHFVVGREGTGYDWIVDVPEGATFEQTQQAAAKASRDSFRAQGLRDLANLGWLTVFFVGPIVAFSLIAALFLPLISAIFRKLPRKAALGALAGIGLLAVAGILASTAGIGGTIEAARTIRETDPAEPGSGGRLVPFFGHPEPNIRFEATYMMYWCVHEDGNRRPEYLAPLLGALRDPDLRVRLWACGALGKLGNREAVPALLEALRDPEIFVRYRAAEALGDLRAPEAVEPLLAMTREDWWYCGMYALTALRKIRPEKY